ncbi:hypothetical protein VTG60DRAFT_3587 [Thermothelomyces hinnuleus]
MQYFQVELPKIEEPLIAKASDVWEKYFAEIRSLIGDAVPDILPFFDSTREAHLNINTELCESISSSIKSLSEGTSQIRPLFIGSLRTGLLPLFNRTGLLPLFNETLQIEGTDKQCGKATSPLAKRTSAPPSPPPRPASLRRAWAAWRLPTSSVRAPAPRSCGRSPDPAVRRARIQVGLLLQNLEARPDNGPGGHTALIEMLRLQKKVKTGTLAWAAVWKVPPAVEPEAAAAAAAAAAVCARGEGDSKVKGAVGVGGGCFEIPEEYAEVENEDEKDDGGGEDGEEDEEDRGMSSDTEDADWYPDSDMEDTLT